MKSISNQILAYILISLSVVYVARYFYNVHTRTQFETQRLEKNNVRTCERLAYFVVNPILHNDSISLKTNINFEALDENIGSIQILDQSNHLYAGVVSIKGKTNPINGNQPLVLRQDSIVRPILYQGKTLGKVVLYSNKEPLQQFLGELKQMFVLEICVIFLSIAILLFFVLKRVVINPLSILKKWVSSINTDNSIPKPKLFHSTEVDTIIDTVSELTDRLIFTLKENLIQSRQIFEKESLMSSISTNLPEGMIYRLSTYDNGDRKFTYLSGSFQKIYGHTPEEGMNDASLIFGRVLREDIPLLLEAEAESKKNLSTYRCEVRMVNLDGTRRFSRFVSTPTPMEDGSISWDGLELDITDLKKTQSDLQQNKFLLESITEGLPDIIFAKDINARYTFVNSAVANRVNKTPEEFLGKDNSTIYSPEEAKKTLEKDLEIMETGEMQTFEEELTTSSGIVTFLTTKGPIKDAQGKTIGMFGIARDITDLKKVQSDLQRNKFLLESITEGLPDVVFAMDLDGRYLFVNSALAKSANKKPEELLGKDNRDNFPPEEAKKILEKDLEIMKTGQIQTFEEQLTRPFGKVVYLTTKGPIKDAEGKTVGMFGIARDITDRKIGEEALRVSQEKFEFAFNSSPNAIFIQDEQTGEILETNATSSKIFGYSQEEILFKTTLELNLYKNPKFREKVIEILNGKGSIRNVEVLSRHKSGADLHIVFSAERHYVDHKPFLFVNMQDVSERKQVELELQKLNLDKDRFISILGHDLRSPVNNILLLLELLHADLSNMEMEESEEIVDLAYKSAKNTSKLLDDVLLWATAQSGKMEFNSQMINFKTDCLNVVELMQANANAKNITIELHCEDSLEVYVDKNMLDTVLRNLISNAIKFTHTGGKITLSAEKTTQEVVISVADNGVGIEPKDVGKIFDKAQMFTSIGTNAEKGTGFGLKLCQEFVEKHNGKIWVESEVGKGTCFYFSLPNAV
ncbi:PAS domain S-box-containing protein [Flavobacterium fluvii]|uniref:histidine kinase n=1 Tax=Flavobacterium fluvii TaxID=468056 RepID=A0A1M5IFZ7_9FLAO|nr:PAS domain-containing sensor histidine kinase [Flavobacterium fluvii]SHG27212.1 PAS domain S-box-containing protein [Flavobacterium fluvii]